MVSSFLTFLPFKVEYTYEGDCMIYIDLVVIINLFMNYLVLLSTGIILVRMTKLKKIFLASTIGCIPLIFLFININKIPLFIINFLFGIIMSIIAFNYKDIFYTFKNVLYMYFISIFISGGLYLINTNIFPKLDNSILSFVTLIVISPLITIIYLKIIKSIKNFNSNYYQVDIYLKDKPIITLNAYLDTGNKLTSPYNGKPVILVAKKSIMYDPPKTILVPYHTIDSHSMINCFSPEKIYIHDVGVRRRVLIAIIDEVPIEDAQCILNEKLLERI